MDWILKHFQLVVILGSAIAWWLNQRRQADQEVPPAKDATFEDPDLAARTRRIREEIQRKIEQRARGYVQPPPAAVRPESPAPPAIPVARSPAPVAEPPPLSRAAASHLEAQHTAEILEQQATLATRLQQAQEMKAAALLRLQYENQISSGDQAATVARGALADDLRSPDALRRAFILREIIGRPLALR